MLSIWQSLKICGVVKSEMVKNSMDIIDGVNNFSGKYQAL